MGGNLVAEFDWSHIQPAEVLEAARSYRFPAELRSVLLGYFGYAVLAAPLVL